MKLINALSILLFLCSQIWIAAAEESHNLDERQVIFLGESHTNERDHQGQLEVLKSLAEKDSKPLLVVLEMFNETGTQGLADYVAGGEMSPEYWSDQWGHPYPLYQPIFEWMRSEGHHFEYLRPAPSRTKAVREDDAWTELRKLGDFYLGPPAYRDFMAQIAAGHLPAEMKLTEEMIDRYFLIQCFWDEFMSWRVATLVKENPDSTCVVLVGHGHLHPNFGIPRRLRRRLPDVKLSTVGFEKDAEWEPDFIWELKENLSERP